MSVTLPLSFFRKTSIPFQLGCLLLLLLFRGFFPPWQNKILQTHKTEREREQQRATEQRMKWNEMSNNKQGDAPLEAVWPN